MATSPQQPNDRPSAFDGAADANGRTPTNQPPRGGRRPPFYLVQAFHSVVGYALWYVGDGVLSARELSTIATLLSLRPKALMLFLRLATRSQRYFSMARLRQQYTANGTVREADNDGSDGAGEDDDSASGGDAGSPTSGGAGDEPGGGAAPPLMFGTADAMEEAVRALEACGVIERIGFGEVVVADVASRAHAVPAAAAEGPAAEDILRAGAAPGLRDVIAFLCRVKDLHEMLMFAGIDVTSAARTFIPRNPSWNNGNNQGGGRGAAPKPPAAAATDTEARPARGGHRSERGRGRGSGGASAAATRPAPLDPPTAAGGGGGLRGGARMISKDLLVDMAVANATVLSSGAWDHIIGDIVRVTASATSALARLSELFALISGFAPETTQHGGGSPPPLPAIGTVLAVIRAAAFPVRLPYVPFLFQTALESPRNDGSVSPRSPVGDDLAPDAGDDEAEAAFVDPHADCLRPRRVSLFPTRQHLDLCAEALSIEQRLFYLTEDNGRRDRGTDAYQGEIHALAVRVRRGLKASEDLLTAMTPPADFAAPAWLADLDVNGVTPRKQHHVHHDDDLDCQTWPPLEDDLESLFLRRSRDADSGGDALAPGPYDHLHSFLPTYRFLKCAARLGDAFESLKDIDGALFFFRTVLNTRIEVRRKWHSAMAKKELLKSRSVVFQVRKRGEYHLRVVMDLARANPERALRHCEALFHVAKNDEGKEAAAQALVLPDEVFTTVRRADRLAIERTMKRLHAPPRRWNALPDAFLTNELLLPRDTYVTGKRDPTSRDWLDGMDGSGRVEAVALKWYVAGRGRREKGWGGVHCEGGWMSALFAVVFHDILFDAPRSDLVYLTPFQTTPLDMGHPGAFYGRRATRIGEALSELEGLSQDEFVAMVHEYIEAHRGELTDFVPWDLHLLDIARSIPLRPLSLLFRTLITQQEGHYIRFSGVPDLCLYRDPRAIATASGSGGSYANGATAAPPPPCSFLLVEVKGPNDKLSDKQRAMNDLLLRCGFAVEVCYVKDEDPSEELAARGRSNTFGDRVSIGDLGREEPVESDEEDAKRESERIRRLLDRRQRANLAGQIRQRRPTPHSPTQV